MNHESLLDTIRRLLALSKSPNEHEAQLAAAKAAELMRRHNLDAASVASRGEHVEETAEAYQRVPYVVHLVADLVDRHFFVESFLAKKADTEIVFYGRRENVAVALYVYHVLLRTFKELARQHCHAHGGHVRRLYLLGLRDGYERTIEKQTPPPTAVEAGLITAERTQLKRALTEHLGCELGKPAKLAPLCGDRNSYEQGRRDGAKITVNTALPADHPSGPRLLA